MHGEFNNLEKKLKNYLKNDPVYYVANPGNWGDALIRAGTIKFFRDIGLDYQEIRLSKKNWSAWLKPFTKGGTVIYGGGGGWCEDWSNASKYVKYLSKRFKVIVLPSTFMYSFSHPRTTYFCRDKYESKQNMPEAEFCHDMALYLGKIEFKRGSGTGYFFRTDAESLGRIPIPKGNLDLSKKGNHLSEVITFFKEIANFEVIHTDRLHVAIGACLTGRRLHFYPGSYFKNYAVYRSSLEGNFKNITFHSDYTEDVVSNSQPIN